MISGNQHRRRNHLRFLVSPLIAIVILGATGAINLGLPGTSSCRTGFSLAPSNGGRCGTSPEDQKCRGLLVSHSTEAKSAGAESPLIGVWPPKVGLFYPDLILKDQNGERFQLSDLAGKVILLELAAIPCAGCQAYAGGNQVGGFRGIAVQPGLESIHEYARQFAKIDLGHHRDVVFVQLLLYGKAMREPTQSEVKRWANHFGLQRTDHQIVLRGDPALISQATYDRIPGFHLIDRDFVLRFDSSGHRPHDDLYRDLLPALGMMARSR